MASGSLMSGVHSKVYSRKAQSKAAADPDPSPAPAASDDASSLAQPLGNGRHVTISLPPASRRAALELRRRLAVELEQVRALSRRLEAHELQAAAAHSQLSATDPNTPVSVRSGAGAPVPFGRKLTAAPAADASSDQRADKEKRTPKANQYYRAGDFLVGKDKTSSTTPAGDGKKSKTKSKKQTLASSAIAEAERKLYAPVFRSCTALLSKLMKHKHAWVFNEPVDAVGLGLHDYHTIIKHPMDLGTVRSRLNSGYYHAPQEFASDIRLTFRNAMTYNPRGQDVHAMADQMLRAFEEQWPAVEAEIPNAPSPPVPPPPPPSRKLPPPQLPTPMDNRALEQSDSNAALESVPRAGNHISAPVQTARPTSLKKPKAREPNKREMTLWEKQRLSNNLQNLPPEKLESVVQIIKRRNLSLSQHDDEIEVDIDSFDVETLWELDRFVMNYKKSVTKNKRKAELAVLARTDEDLNRHPMVQEMAQETASLEPPPKKAIADERYMATSSPARGDRKRESAVRSSTSGSSSSESGSSSSDTDSNNSSADGSDVGQSPRT